MCFYLLKRKPRRKPTVWQENFLRMGATASKEPPKAFK
jgi:hypothetical protein